MNPAGDRVVLALETAFPSVSVALQIGGRIRLPEEVPCRARASDLHPALLQCLESEGLRTSDIDLILVDQGPGSYTGLRIGLAVARTLSHLHGTPILSSYSTDSLAWMGRDLVTPGEEFVVALDARRIHWTLARYRREDDGLSRLQAPEVMERSQFQEIADRLPLVLCAEDEPPTRTRVEQVGIPTAERLFELDSLRRPDPSPLPLYLMPAT